MSAAYRPQKILCELPAGFHDAVEPARFPAAIIRFQNRRWATRVGLGDASDDDWVRYFAQFEPLPGSLPQPLAMRYHGHQFRSYNPDLGDGRGFTYAQLLDDRDRLLDLGTKGSGKTPYSRGGDGRLTLKGGVREVLATEMLEALDVYTSKTFSLIETGEALQRNDEPSPTRSSVLVRLGHSHIRFGSFQRHADEGRADRVRILADHCIESYFPELQDEPEQRRYNAFFAEVTQKTADLVASWMVAGFVHGVLNTDNMNICGESFDYGPWRFIPHYDPRFTAAYFDYTGLYAFGRQPNAVLWNLARLAEALGALLNTDVAQTLLDEQYISWLHSALARRFCGRLGIAPGLEDDDRSLIEATFQWLATTKADYAHFFHDWFGGESSARRAAQSSQREHYACDEFAPVRQALKKREPQEGVLERLNLPYFQESTPQSLLIDEVEAIWSAISERDDWSRFEAKVQSIRTMGAALGTRPLDRV